MMLMLAFGNLMALGFGLAVGASPLVLTVNIVAGFFCAFAWAKGLVS